MPTPRDLYGPGGAAKEGRAGMPTYEYACTNCGEHLEVVQSFRDDALTECPACGGPLRKVFGSIGIVFKGKGFYKTDSRPGDAAKKTGSDTAAATSDTGSSAAKESASTTKDAGTAGSSSPTGGSSTTPTTPASPPSTSTSSPKKAAAS